MSNASTQPPVVWLASYPKSGNTWLRFSVTALIEGKIPSSQFVKERMPDIHEQGFKPFPLLEQGIVFAKTHHAFSDTMPGRQQTAGFIYIVRHPVDVVASNYNYILRNAPSKAMPIEHYVESFLAHFGDPKWIHLKMGSWLENVTSWIEASGSMPAVVLRYEDMLKDPLASLRSIAGYLALERSEEELQEAARLCSFESMKALEEREVEGKVGGMFYDPQKTEILKTGKRFVNAGGSKASKAMLSDSQRAKIAELFRPITERLGYPE